ncbi:MAG: lysylphosphatidylglycerol synthase transmembrane domain-containing protein [Bacteroidota bacterium]|nr:lysylphosphatidylglycerol synthase transmembrane domain-containing protein [Bacteroidota bacterium]
MNKNIKSALQYLVIVLIGVFFMYFVFKDTDWSDLFVRLKSANLNWLLIGISVGIFSHWLRAYRATLLYHAMGYHVSTINSFYAVLIGYMMNYVIPRAGEVSRCAALVKTDRMPLEKSFGSLVTERIVDVVMLIIVLAIIFLLQFELIYRFISKSFHYSDVDADTGFPLKWLLLLIVAAIGVLIYVLRKKLAASPLFVKIFELIEGFGDGLLSIRHVKKPWLFVFLSFSIWFCYILMMYFCLFAMEPTNHLLFLDGLTVFAIGTIGVVLPAPGAGAGTFHFFVSQSLLLFGVAIEDGIAYATMVHGAQMLVLLVLGSVASLFVLVQQKNNKTNEQTS